MKINLKQIDGNNLEIELSAKLKSHFGTITEYMKDSPNYAYTILEQINTGLYEKFLDPTRKLIILDIGANIGLVALHLLPICDRLICIEPSPSHFKLLKELTENTIIECEQIAVSNTDGKIDFYFSNSNSTINSLIKQPGHFESKKVNSKTLSKLIFDLSLDHIDFIKVDIEGSEMIALNEDELKRASDIVDSYYVECHVIDNIGSKENMDILKVRFKNAGYKITDILYDSLYAFK